VKARGEYPRIASCFTGSGLDAVEGELSGVYKGKLEKYTRSFVYMKPDYLVMFDDATSRDPERYSWVFNAEGKNVFQGSGSTVRIVRPKAELRLDILSPGELDRTVKPHPDRDGSLVMLTTPERASTGRFLAVLIPSREDNRAERNAWKTSRIDVNGWIGAEVRRGEITDRILFRTDQGNGMVSAGEWETDGDRVAVSTSQNFGIWRLWVQDATRLNQAGVSKSAVLRSTERLSALIEYIRKDHTFIMVTTDSKGAAQVSLKVERKPEKFQVNNKDVKYEYDRKAGMVTVVLPAGKNGIWIQ
jgi:hypothetical protein